MRKPTVLCRGQVPHFNESTGELEHISFREETDMLPDRLKKYKVFRAFKYLGMILFCSLPIIWLIVGLIFGDVYSHTTAILTMGPFLAAVFFALCGVSGCEDLEIDTNIDNYPEVSQKWQAQAAEAYLLEAEYKNAHAEAIVLSTALKSQSPKDAEKLLVLLKEYLLKT